MKDIKLAFDKRPIFSYRAGEFFISSKSIEGFSVEGIEPDSLERFYETECCKIMGLRYFNTFVPNNNPDPNYPTTRFVKSYIKHQEVWDANVKFKGNISDPIREVVFNAKADVFDFLRTVFDQDETEVYAQLNSFVNIGDAAAFVDYIDMKDKNGSIECMVESIRELVSLGFARNKRSIRINGVSIILAEQLRDKMIALGRERELLAWAYIAEVTEWYIPILKMADRFQSPVEAFQAFAETRDWNSNLDEADKCAAWLDKIDPDVVISITS